MYPQKSSRLFKWAMFIDAFHSKPPLRSASKSASLVGEGEGKGSNDKQYLQPTVFHVTENLAA